MTEKQHEIEVEGKTTEEAINKAIKHLGVKKEDVIIEIICEEEKGLFGMEGAKMAKVKVSMKKRFNIIIKYLLTLYNVVG